MRGENRQFCLATEDIGFIILITFLFYKWDSCKLLNKAYAYDLWQRRRQNPKKHLQKRFQQENRQR